MTTIDSPDSTPPVDDIEEIRWPDFPVEVVHKFEPPDGGSATLWNYGHAPQYSAVLPPIVSEAVATLPTLAAKLNLPTFFAALGERLGAYRHYDELTSHQLPVVEVKAEVGAALVAMQQAWHYLFHLPPLAKALLKQMSSEETPYARHADSLLARLVDVQQLVDDLLQLQHRLEDEFPAQEGRPCEWRRNDLLTDVCELARTHATKPLQWQEAGELAQWIMIAARVTVPSSVDEILRIVREVRKQRNVTEPHGTPADAEGNDTTEMGKTCLE